MNFIKKHIPFILTVVVVAATGLFLYSCEPKVRSLNNDTKHVTRNELQIELDTIIKTAELRFADLQQQERLRQLILQNALLIAQGQPFNPIGILTGISAIYGAAQGGSNITKVVKKKLKNNKGPPDTPV